MELLASRLTLDPCKHSSRDHHSNSSDLTGEGARQLPTVQPRHACLPELRNYISINQPAASPTSFLNAPPHHDQPSPLACPSLERFYIRNQSPYFRLITVRMPGFDFSNYNRNAALHARGVPLPKATSTGTTIVGCIFDGGVVVRIFCCLCTLFPQRLQCNGAVIPPQLLPTDSAMTFKLTSPLPLQDRSRYSCHLGSHRCRQELREAALHCPSDLVCWCRYRCRH